ncbi:YbaK/prolyl-tRNA synthetase associated domain-containing protein [Caballeronia sp. LZ035]|uniref:YbaK/prolyl-tRNA synthetase associated domain-containing protein n=1 Tax=Caballeronia sp. LZ035 TaxID=3038568 RepID=UPI00285C5989|nr:YbaK/prolyl-tRNA synthetase associated domain-containing protein [Caballeronia sp. LZ035]MDR5762779.1 YbaK/prolyl-tRNA synthetase associated domain-containing protein [Caballeronia sp. LZ035]
MVTSAVTTPFDQLIDALEREGARYRVLEHPEEGRCDLVAALRGTEPGQGAKAMLCKSKDADGQMILAILPGDRKLDFKKVATAAGIRKATLATPEEAQRETGCVIGAIPPFSFSPAVKLIVDPELIERFDEIAFNAGRLDRSMLLASVDYLRIARPLVSPLCA